MEHFVVNVLPKFAFAFLNVFICFVYLFVYLFWVLDY